MAITSAPAPQISLGLNLGVTVGRNQVQRNVGRYNALYLAPDSNIVDSYLELAATKNYVSNVSENTQTLIVSTSGPLNFTGVQMDDTTISFTINRLLVVDSELKSWTLSNTGTDVVRLNINAINSPVA